MVSTSHRRRSAPKAVTPKPAPETVEEVVETPDSGPTDDPTAEVEAPTEASEPGHWRPASDPMIRAMNGFANDLQRVGRPDANIEYGSLLAALRSSGWFLRMREVNSFPRPDGGITVTLALEAGTGAAATWTVDHITMSAPPGAPDPSLWARAKAYPSIIMALFGQLPPLVPAGEPEASREELRQHVADLDHDDAGSGEWEALNLVDERTKDGLPIYYDPFSLSEEPRDIVDSFIVSLRDEVPKIQSLAGLGVLFEDNSNMFDYVKETHPDEYDRIIGEILNPRREELADLDGGAQVKTGGRSPGRR